MLRWLNNRNYGQSCCEAPTIEGYEDAIVISGNSPANTLKIKHGHLNPCPKQAIFGRSDKRRSTGSTIQLQQLDTFISMPYILNEHRFIILCCGGNFLDKMPLECLKIIESNPRTIEHRAKSEKGKLKIYDLVKKGKAEEVEKLLGRWIDYPSSTDPWVSPRTLCTSDKEAYRITNDENELISTLFVTDERRAENLAADHLSRLENPHQDKLENKEINEAFPLETLGSIALQDQSDKTLCFPTGKSFRHSQSCHSDLLGTLMVPITTARKVLRFRILWPTIYKDAMTLSPRVTFFNVQEKMTKRDESQPNLHPRNSRIVKTLILAVFHKEFHILSFSLGIQKRGLGSELGSGQTKQLRFLALRTYDYNDEDVAKSSTVKISFLKSVTERL
ncbi:hypothetical protein Tco_1090830 [Tanacetum coccineum]|uniref:Uncharacterized protein n=1 Tax=Tanacetum coccineum TaxID=301880 RepID=A0ABQ5I5D5_9ASTR